MVNPKLLPFLLLLLNLLPAPVCSGQMQHDTARFSADAAQLPEEQISTPIYFRIGESTVDTTFAGNHDRIIRFLRHLQHIQNNPGYVITRIVVTGTASPDGTEERNLQLAGGRAANLAAWLTGHTGISPEKISVVNGGENWAALRSMIEASGMPFKADMLRLMDQYADNRDDRKIYMQYFAGSKPWLWMYEHFFPALRIGAGGTRGYHRQGSGISFYYKPAVTSSHSKEKRDDIIQPVTPIPSPVHVIRRTRLLPALKTNLLQWAGYTPGNGITTFMPNLALEVYFARRWSAEVNALYVNRDYYRGNKLWAISSYGTGARFWMRNDATFRGLWLGIYAQCGEFDQQQNKNRGNRNYTGSFLTTGLSAGWTHPLSQHWAVEACIRGGYRHTRTDRYDIERDDAGTMHYYFNTTTGKGKFTPDVRLNVVYRFGKPAK